jgi:hypothetical protein
MVQWRKSSYSSSQANCVEVAHLDCEWRKSTGSSANANCVEVAMTGPAVAIRDSKNAAGPVLVVASSGWVAFLSDRRR